jgi:hypothetical protein
MSNTGIVYTVRAIRWGDRENHSYICGVYFKKAQALKAADFEEDYRGGKYSCEVEEHRVRTKAAKDAGATGAVIRHPRPHPDLASQFAIAAYRQLEGHTQ